MTPGQYLFILGDIHAPVALYTAIVCTEPYRLCAQDYTQDYTYSPRQTHEIIQSQTTVSCCHTTTVREGPTSFSRSSL